MNKYQICTLLANLSFYWTFKTGLWVQITLWICVFVLWIHKGYYVVKKLWEMLVLRLSGIQRYLLYLSVDVFKEGAAFHHPIYYTWNECILFYCLWAKSNEEYCKRFRAKRCRILQFYNTPNPPLKSFPTPPFFQLTTTSSFIHKFECVLNYPPYPFKLLCTFLPLPLLLC